MKKIYLIHAAKLHHIKMTSVSHLLGFIFDSVLLVHLHNKPALVTGIVRSVGHLPFILSRGNAIAKLNSK